MLHPKVSQMEESDRLIADGCERLRSAHEPTIRAEVELRYADQMASNSWFKRRKPRKQIENEVASRLDDFAPPDALY